MELSERIRLVREAAGFTQADIASELGISPQAYGKIERQAEKTTIENLRKIAVTLDVNVSFLIDVMNPSLMEQKNNL
jgi:transcriptional regulator with XRE-family HTH domain